MKNVSSTSARPGNGRPQRLRGIVVGAQQMTKTIIVVVERLVWHKKLHKQFRRSKRYLVHDEREEGRVGDAVVIEQTRPLSRQKRFRLLERTPGKELVLEDETEGEES